MRPAAPAPKLRHAFSVVRSTNQTIGIGFTRLAFDTKDWDIDSEVLLAGTVACRFHPKVPGYYAFNLGCYVDTSGVGETVAVALYLNGAELVRGNQMDAAGGTNDQLATLSYVWRLDGLDDYVEPYGYCNVARTSYNTRIIGAWWQGYLIGS